MSNEKLSALYRTIVAETEPDQFIDLLCANSFIIGTMGGNIPVNENRIAFERWLASRYQQIALAAQEESEIACRKLRLKDEKVHKRELLATRIDEASHYCDDGHYHDKEADMAMLSSERLTTLKQNQNPAHLLAQNPGNDPKQDGERLAQEEK